MLKFELVLTDKYSTSNLLQRKNPQFLRRINHQKRCLIEKTSNEKYSS